MTKNRFEEISHHLHFSNSTKEPARGAVNYDRLFKVRTVIDYVRVDAKIISSPQRIFP